MSDSGTSSEFLQALFALSKIIDREPKIGINEDLSEELKYLREFYSALKLRQAKQRIAVRHGEWDILRVEILLPDYDEFYNFAYRAVEAVKALDFIYLIFATLDTKNAEAIKGITNDLDKHHESFSENPLLSQTYWTMPRYVKPLEIVSAHYGSTAAFDLLGIGKILEILRDTIKDISWRSKHEKQLANLEIETKAIELKKKQLELEKDVTEITLRKLEIIEKSRDLRLSRKEHEIIITALKPKFKTLAESPMAVTNPLKKPQEKFKNN